MSLSRYAPHRLRVNYLRALRTLPIPAPQTEPIDPERLTVLGRAWIDRRRVVFGTATDAPRLWVAFNESDTEPSLLGYMTGLACGEPDLWVCNDAHRAWTLEGDNTANLKRAAARVWSDCQRDCEG
ncbi:hypothetical protein [Glycomyces tenuis]|uniref:hypothetical protein n=1 Tax=Glycomyces tenuis TaxID=58116 RepID=UPI00040D5369|nr:hypothetical protein [Glycomyces tenuis]